MENASKALIIAGAILLAILLISLGIMIFNQASSVVSGSGMTDAQKTTYNAKFQKYEGSIKGAQLKSLINDIMVVNNDDDPENNITLDDKSTADNKSIASTNWVNTNKTYIVSFPTYTNGIITAVKIDKIDK